jgi:virginiamycin B lyase
MTARRSSLTILTTIALAIASLALGVPSALAVPPTISGVEVTEVTSHSAVLNAKVNPEKKATFFHFEYGAADCAIGSCTSLPAAEPNIGSGSSPVAVEATLEGLTEASTYHYRVIAHHSNGSDEVVSPDRTFATHGPPQSFGPCPNDAFRADLPSDILPDCRAYEQTTPLDKASGDTVGYSLLLGASPSGDAVPFMGYIGFPGAEGAQDFPFFLASRGGGAWSSQSLMPPASYGEVAKILGWQPDYSEVFAMVGKQGKPDTKALFMRTPGGLTMIAPYLPEPQYAFVGASADGSLVVFESTEQLPGTVGVKDAPNVYSWDRETGTTTLVGVQNDGKAPAAGSIAGPYDWARGTNSATLREGGARSTYLTQESHVVSEDGASIYFTAAASGQLYLRRNSLAEQSALDSQGNCTEPAKACTIRVSASEKTIGKGTGGTELGGPRPPVFHAASTDGSIAYLTSSEELTDDANTGPEPIEPPKLPTIGRANLEGKEIKGDFLPAHATGIVTDSEYVYWADPESNSIGRALVNGEESKPTFITGLESIVDLTIGGEYLYWTNSSGNAIGRAKKLDGTGVEQKFIEGAPNPQGIAVDGTYVYWTSEEKAEVGRARADLSQPVEADFIKAPQILGVVAIPQRIAVDGSHIYLVVRITSSLIIRYDLEGNLESNCNADKCIDFSQLSGDLDIAVDGNYVYWSAPGKGGFPQYSGIGRATLDLTGKEDQFIPAGFYETGESFILSGDVEHPLTVAVDSGHIYWANDPPLSSKLGNDLYRFEADKPAGERLTDLVPDSADPNGAEVKGVLSASEDGSRLYFVANGVLTNVPNERGETATAGTCAGRTLIQDGACNLYLWQEGTISFVAPIDGRSYWNWLPLRSFDLGYQEKYSRMSADGSILVFASSRQLSGYENKKREEFYRYDAETGRIDCLTCNPTGEAPTGEGPFFGPSLKTIQFTTLLPQSQPVSQLPRNLSGDGSRFFFETTEALVGADVNGKEGCPVYGGYLNTRPTCLDVYEWEAAGKGSCSEASLAYSDQNRGCLYLISTGTKKEAQFFAGASESGDDVFFFTRSQLVGQDTDNLRDVYDASAGGGLASQYPPPPLVPCEGDVCKPGASTPPPTQSAGSASFVGPVNPKPTRRGKRQRHHKQKKHPHKKKHRRAQHNRRASR